MTQRNVILLGGPGAGKGTQAARIVADYALPHVSTGEMLRAAVARGTEMGREAQKYMESGRLVPDEVVIGVVRERLAEPDAAEGFLLDGFPRTVPQAEELDAMLAEAGRGITHVVLIDVPAEELVQRIAGRRSCASCGKIYNVTFDPPQADGVCDARRRRAHPARRRQRGDGAQPHRRLRGADGAAGRVLHTERRARERVRRRQGPGRGLRAGQAHPRR